MFIRYFFIFLAFFFTNSTTLAESYYYSGTVENIVSETYNEDSGFEEVEQTVKVSIPQIQKTKTIEHGGLVSLQENQKLSENEKVIIHHIQDEDFEQFYIVDKLRLSNTLFIFILFFGVIALVIGRQGVFSLFGLLVSLFVLAFWVAPQILSGASPIFISFIGSIIIATLSMYIAHGIKMRTTLALGATLGTLLLAVLFSYIFIKIALLSGAGSENTYFLQTSTNTQINLQGVLFAGILIGTLGVLDDITATQVTAIEEIKAADPKANFKQLFSQGFSIGKEHILSMVNTLALAYAGASFPLFLLFTIESSQPLWVTLNSEFIVEEIVRTLAGSTALILAVPISCALGAWYYGKK